MKWWKPKAETVKNVALFAGLLAVAGAALAQSTVPGGMTTANDTAKGLRQGIYEIAGSIAGIYLIVLFLLVKLDRKSWGDFGMGVVWCSVGGAAVLIATWAWGLFTAGGTGV